MVYHKDIVYTTSYYEETISSTNYHGEGWVSTCYYNTLRRTTSDIRSRKNEKILISEVMHYKRRQTMVTWSYALEETQVRGIRRVQLGRIDNWIPLAREVWDQGIMEHCGLFICYIANVYLIFYNVKVNEWLV
jgi:hypothetical protein